MSALDRNRLSPLARRKLQELERRFDNSLPTPPRPLKARSVVSPIEEESSRLMSDDDWIRALKKYAKAETQWSTDGAPIGGAVELSRQLGTRAKEHPARFARLALRFKSDIPAAALTEILSNTKEVLDANLLADLCEHAHKTYGSGVGRSVCGAIADAQTINSRLVRLICVYAQNTDPDNTSRNGHNGDLLFAGINSTRGQAAHAVAMTLFDGDSHVEDLLPTLSSLAVDKALSVRVCAAQSVLALLNHRREYALDLTERLFAAPIEVMNAPTTEQLLMYAVLWDPERFIPTLERMLSSSSQIAKGGGRVWAVAYQQDMLGNHITSDVRSLPAAARQGAAEVFVQQVASSLEILPLLFNDDNEEVREISVRSLLDLKDIPTTSGREALIHAYMESKASPAHLRRVMRALAEITTALPSNAIDFCERAVEIAGSDLGDGGIAYIGHYILAIILRLYRQGDKSMRGRCLDVIDRLTELNVYDMASILDDEK